ncbi:hypothetical protein PALI_a3209 [Pseudoalteromonas aliena SW19]|uniref:Uncharacterized protein n=1 Tax=Pseudoalteromonas aliena SW19 TaxID=1314866 RepID=A0ABR9DW83_9GAMM|nr:hypothetical protein [Pseudoalteromonas aliena SW19]
MRGDQFRFSCKYFLGFKFSAVLYKIVHSLLGPVDLSGLKFVQSRGDLIAARGL